MGASSSRAGGGRGRSGGRASIAGPRQNLLKPQQQQQPRRSDAPRASPRRVAPSDEATGSHNSSVISETIQGLRDQGQLIIVSPAVEEAASHEQMLAPVMDGRNSNEEIVTSQITQAIEALHIAGNTEDRPCIGCGFEAPEVTDKFKGTDYISPIIEEEEDDCPICLEGFDEENPKLVTQCEHRYHLSCLLEWMERSGTCPMCGQVAIFDETS